MIYFFRPDVGDTDRLPTIPMDFASAHNETMDETTEKTDSQSQRQMKVLSVGLPRTATLSLAEALEILGLQNVYHSLRTPNIDGHYPIIDRAADGSFPTLATYDIKKAPTREQWDKVFGDSEAVTEVASLFAPQLIKAYPEAKVILVIRDFDNWYRSLDESLLKGLWSPLANFFASYVQPIIGLSSIAVTRKVALGFFEANTVDEIRQNAKLVYERHHRQIKEMVPPENLLIYKMGSGWAPLCEFLGKPIPEREFPWVNEAEELKAKTVGMLRSQLFAAGKQVFVPKFITGAIAKRFNIGAAE